MDTSLNHPTPISLSTPTTLPRPPAHVRADRTLREVLYPLTELSHDLAQVNYIAVSEHGQFCPPHSHTALTETFVCLEGILELSTSTGLDPLPLTRHILYPGSFLTVSPTTVHALRATPFTRYLELRSTLYRDELFNPDKHFLTPEDADHISALNREAYEQP